MKPSDSEPHSEASPPMELFNESIFEKVCVEIQNDGPQTVLWERAFSETNGDMDQAVKAYIGYRYKELAIIHAAEEAADLERERIANEAAKRRQGEPPL